MTDRFRMMSIGWVKKVDSASGWAVRSVVKAVAAALLVMLLVGGVALLADRFTPLPEVGAAPGYALIDQYGRPVSDQGLRGKIVLYDFIYTYCTTVCPALTGQMRQVQDALADRGWLGETVMLVSITFDPERDTPARLLQYSQSVNADPESWLWLTGDVLEVKQLVGSECGVYFERIDASDSNGSGAQEYDFVHSNVLLLVDARGQVRAEYHNLPGAAAIMSDIDRLVRQQAARGPVRWFWQIMGRLETVH